MTAIAVIIMSRAYSSDAVVRRVTRSTVGFLVGFVVSWIFKALSGRVIASLSPEIVYRLRCPNG